MKLRRQKRTTSKALDGLASITKIWTDGRVGKTAGKASKKCGKAAGKGVAKAKSLRPPSKARKLLGSKPLRVGGVVAVVAGAGGAFRKLKKKPDPVYTPPSPTEPVAAPPATDPPPLAIAPDPPAPVEPVAAPADPTPEEPAAVTDPTPEDPKPAEEPAAIAEPTPIGEQAEPVAAIEEPPVEEPAAVDEAPADEPAAEATPDDPAVEDKGTEKPAD